ncbi:MAG: hypothetical protein A2046_06025 [Bacteroidetes bacterium GWA2_30_7]|nr:MAG: hypothetical protein A2046_06025 [Bacteroidetes bacterium GWA2_30_7]
MEKKIKKVIKYENLTPELIKEIHKKYPGGYEEHLIKVNGPSHTFFYAFMLDLPDVSYLIKVNVKIDNSYEDESDDFSNEESIGREDDNFANTDNDDEDKEKLKPKTIEENDDDEEEDDADDDIEEDDDEDDIEEEESSVKGKVKSKPKTKELKKKIIPKKAKK